VLKLLPDSGIAKGGSGRAQAHPNVFGVPCHSRSIYSNRKVKYSNIQTSTLLKQLENQIVLYQLIKSGYATVA